MCYPVTWYDALLYRYYCSPWVTPKGLHLEEEEEMENVEDVIPVSSDEGFESDLKKNTMYICVIYIVKNKKRQFSTCHIVYIVGVV